MVRTLGALAVAAVALLAGWSGMDTASACNPPPTYTLTTQVTGQGVVTPSSGVYSSGTVVNISATASTGWTFDHWEVDLTGDTNPTTITMNANKTVRAVFVQEYYDLTLSVNDLDAGTIGASPSPDPEGYLSGTVVTLTATANAGYVFDHWEGDLTGSTNPDTIAMDSDKIVTAIFLPEYTLTATVQGNGSVTLAPPGGTYAQGMQVTLTAVPETGWAFDHWEVDLTGDVNPSTLTMTANKSVTAVFVEEFFDLNLTINDLDGGTVDLTPEPGPEGYAVGTVVTVTATANPGWVFVRWEGDLTGSTNPDTITMDSEKFFTAYFLPEYTLTTTAQGNGSVVLVPPGGLYAEGTQVTLTAIADSGWAFDHWEGALTGSANPDTITVDADKTATAVFVQEYASLSLSVNNMDAGMVEAAPSPGPEGYALGTPVSVTAVANPGWAFDHWTGDLSGSTNPDSVTMDSDKSVTAVFEQEFYDLTLAVNDIDGGSVDAFPAPGAEGYAYETVVTVTATANSGWVFDHWEGGISGSTNPDTITMHSDSAITAFFVPEYTLTATAQGSGTINLTPTGGTYIQGTQVTLTAVANEHWHFDYWDGDASGSNEVTVVTMDSNKSITAVFAETFYALSLNVSYSGHGTASAIPTPGPEGYLPGTTVTLTATANSGYAFSHWTGDLATTANPDVVLMDADKSVTAVFIPLRLLDVSTEADPCLPGVAQGTVSLAPPYQHLMGYQYGDSCIVGKIYEIPDETAVTLTAEPDPGALFDHWEGAVTGSENPVNVLMDANKEVRAVFTPQFTLTVNVVGTGSVSPGSGVYDAGSLINLTATPTGQDVYFVEWQGDLVGSVNPGLVTLDSDKIVTAVFAKMYQVNTYAEGNGTVTPESGLFLEGTEIVVSATADANWGFDEWIGDLPGATDAEAPGFVVTVDGPLEFTALFVERPGQTDIDMVGDLGYFLTVIGESATVETFDCNGIDYDNAFNRLYVGNGLPDVVELYLLEKVLKTYGLSFTYKSGISHDLVWGAWTANLAQAAVDLDGHDPRVIRVVAGYMTIADFDTVESIRHIVETALSPATLDPMDYTLTAQRHLYFMRDADNDGVTNEMEWQAASPDGSLDNLDAFANAALDGTPPEVEPEGGQQLRSMSSGCDNDACLEHSYLDVTSSAPLNYPLEIGESIASAIPSGQDIALGTWWSARAKPDTDGGWGFHRWQVRYPGGQKSFVRWGRELTVADTLRSTLDLRAEFVRYRLGLPHDTQDFTIDVVGEGGAFESVDMQGNRVIYGPPGSSATLTVHSTDPTDKYLWNVAHGPGAPSPKFTWETSVHIPLVSGENLNLLGYARPEYQVSYPSVSKRIYVTKTGRGIALGAQSGGYGGAFLGSFVSGATSIVEFTAFPDPGWRFVEWQFDGPSPYTNSSPTVYFQSAQNIDRATAVFEPHIECTLDIEIENGGGGAPQCAGYVRFTSGVAKRYYTSIDDPIQLEAVPAPGYVFAGWQGTFLEPTSVNPIWLTVARFGVDLKIKAVFLYDPLILMQGARRIYESDLDVDSDGIPDNVATISATPTMPNLTARINGAPVGSQVQMRLVVSYTRNGRNDISYFPGPGGQDFATVNGAQSWTVPWGTVFAGGDAMLAFQSCGASEDTFDFRILGENPQDTAARSYIQTAAGASHWFAWAIARHESRIYGTYYNQFNSLGAHEREPNWGDPDGWGTMQVDSARGTPITVPELWNWHTNVQNGLAYINTAEADANAYLAAVQRTYPTEYEAPPASHTPNGTSTSLTALEAATIQLYNGASVLASLLNPYGQMTIYRSCWRFDPYAPSGSRWEFVPNSNNYVELVVLAYEAEVL